MFDHIGDVSQRTINRGIRQRAIENAAGRTHKGMSLEILFVARLFADQDHLRRLRSFAKDRLGRM